MSAQNNRTIEQAFRPRARLLQLLGDQLIGSSKLAVFELVKNAYDADASEVTITLGDITGRTPWITVEDNGQGMTLETVQHVWLTPGDDFRERQRQANKRSPRFNRLPLGEKGVGRFAVHKLGTQIGMITRASGQPECVVKIDWNDLLSNQFLEDAAVKVEERDPVHFTGDRTGTVIRIEALRERNWTRREVRDLYRQVTSIASPFADRSEEFKIDLRVPGHQAWISELPDPSDLMARAPWTFAFHFDGEELEYVYEFRGVPGLARSARKVISSEPLQVTEDFEPDDLDPADAAPRKKRARKVVATADNLKGIGPVSGELHVFDRDREIMSRYGQSRLIERYLDQNGGVRVYRDDIRIYNYGEPGDDWLGLDLRRVNSPSRNLSRNIVLGLIELKLDASEGLREKTNREGFVENDAYARLRQIVLGAISVFETERRIDKQALRALTGKAPSTDREISGSLSDVRRIARKAGVLKEIDPALHRVEQEFVQLRSDFLRAGISQVGLAVIFHEVERGIGALGAAFDTNPDIQSLREQIGQLQGVLETSTQLLRKGDKKPTSLRNLVRRARDVSLARFRRHNVQLICPPLEDETHDAIATFAFGLALGSLTNIIDNAIHWLKVGIPEDGTFRRQLFIDIVSDHPEGPAIIVTDNGPGFRDPPEQLVEPFFSRRPDGMGLGLYYANLAMNLNDGALVFPGHGDFEVPESLKGAGIALVFKGEN